MSLKHCGETSQALSPSLFAGKNDWKDWQSLESQIPSGLHNTNPLVFLHISKQCQWLHSKLFNATTYSVYFLTSHVWKCQITCPKWTLVLQPLDKHAPQTRPLPWRQAWHIHISMPNRSYLMVFLKDTLWNFLITCIILFNIEAVLKITTVIITTVAIIICWKDFASLWKCCWTSRFQSWDIGVNFQLPIPIFCKNTSKQRVAIPCCPVKFKSVPHFSNEEAVDWNGKH